ncbi:MAG: sigma-70 family RNA polymerase sigma factor [Dorea sp.]|jgi:RNA polymerase sigma factor (sigma-70 family)|nr:sigma-70 family RNA polymerase sigma factor [Dorea sp.]
MKCDAKTFAQMYEAVYKDMYRFALCMMKNRQEAEDTVSEAVVAAYENIRKLQNEEAFKNWIFTILSNVCRKRLKKVAKEQVHSQEDMISRIPSQEMELGIAVDVRKAFFLLEEEEQVIVGLSVFGGYNSQEIGKALKMNPNTVRSKRSRALQKMECVLR